MNIDSKKRLIALVGLFHPSPSPTGKVAKDYLKVLAAKYDITVVFVQSGLEKVETKNEYYSLISLSNWRIYLQEYFSSQSEKHTKDSLQKKFFSLLVLLMRILGRIQTFLFLPDNNRWFNKKALRKIEELNDLKLIDYVLTISSPFSAHSAGRAFKKKHQKVKWITFTFDPLIHTSKVKRSFIFPKIKDRWNITQEMSVYNEANYNYVTDDVYDNCKHLFNRSLRKTSPLPFMIEKATGEGINYFNNDKINLIFAGRFYNDIRNPEYLLKTFITINNSDMLLHLFITSDCEELIKRYVKMSNGRIILHNPVSVDLIKKILNDADVLINVGNSIAAFKPSKIFEYISTGKPIVNFYQNNIIDETLLIYPLSLQIDINQTKIEKSSMQLELFSMVNLKNVLSWLTISSIYHRNSETFIKEVILPRGFD
tara:strand:+ start:8845 stop:10122 length:1278 start_codon:yes stop_codon:yes gene_type:complete